MTSIHRSMLSVLPALALLGSTGCIAWFVDGPTDDEVGESDGSSNTESSTSTQTTSGESGGNDYVPDADLPNPDACDNFVQDCPEGEKCVPYSTDGGVWDANKCVPIMGDQAPGEPCVWGGITEATDSCDATSGCWDVQEVDGELVGTCHAFCTGSPNGPECPLGTECTVAAQDDVNYCIPTCDPIAQDCSEGLACYWDGGDFHCFVANQNIPAGEPCGFINDCAEGLMCATAEFVPDCQGSSCCAAFCDLGLGDVQCEAVPGTVCVPFFEQGTAPPNYEHVGVCVSSP